MRSKPCKNCGSEWHTKTFCPYLPKKRILTRKRPNKIGKIGRQWQMTRAEWFEQNPAFYYECYLRISPQCLTIMTKEETTLDHVRSRGRAPGLRNDQANLKPACGPCNALKGSRDLEEVI